MDHYTEVEWHVTYLKTLLQGCDASILITSSDRDAERDAEENLSLPGDGFDTVIKAKEAVEAKCPGVVSCADILAIAARDVVRMVIYTINIKKHFSIYQTFNPFIFDVPLNTLKF